MDRSGSLWRIGKVGHKYIFELSFEKATLLLGYSEVVATWERKSWGLSTKVTKVDRKNRTADFYNQKLTKTITLYKPKRGGTNFEDKVFKICVRAFHQKGKVIGRIDINLAQYARAEEVSKRLLMELSHGGDIVASIKCVYQGFQGANVAPSTSVMTAGTGNAYVARSSDIEELDKLLEGISTSSDNVTKSFEKDIIPKQKPGFLNEIKSPRRFSDMQDKNHKSNLAAEIEIQKRRNNNLIRRNKELIETNNELDEIVRDYERECSKLREKNRELQSNINRQLEYDDVIRELKQTKLSLALMHLENDDLKKQLNVKGNYR